MTMRDPRHPGWPEAGERTELRDVAERWKWAYVELAHSEHRTRVLGRSKPRTIGDAKAEYVLHRRGVVEPRTLANDKTALAHLLIDHPAGTSVHRVNLQKTADRLLSEQYTSATVQLYVQTIATFLRWCGAEPEFTLPKKQRPDVRVWTDAEIGRLRKHAGDMLIAVDCGLYMGLRQGEIYGLRWEDLGPQTVRVVRQQGGRQLKGKRARTAVILPGWNHERGTGHVCSQFEATRQHYEFRAVLEAAGLDEPGVRFHSLRHTYARMFLEAKPEMRLLQASLGHASVTTTERLYNWLLPDRAAEMARLAIHGG